jgi:hypothetical protein
MNFLAKVLCKEQTNTYKILVNNANMHALPIGDVGEKLIQYDGNMRPGSLIYVYGADLDSSTRKMYISRFTVLNGADAEGIEIPAEALTLANLSDVTPNSFLSEIYGLDTFDDDDEEEDELPNTENEETS